MGNQRTQSQIFPSIFHVFLSDPKELQKAVEHSDLNRPSTPQEAMLRHIGAELEELKKRVDSYNRSLEDFLSQLVDLCKGSMSSSSHKETTAIVHRIWGESR